MSAIAIGVGVAAAAAGALVSSAMNPKAPKPGQFNPIDIQAEQTKAIEGNLFAMPKIEELASKYNQFNFDQMNKMLGASDPYASQISTQLSKNRLDWSKGLMSKDMADQVQQLTAQRSVGGGYGGSGMQNAALARNFGLTSFGMQQAAQSSEESWMRTAASIFSPHMFDASSMLVKPGEQAAAATSERDKSLTYQNASNQYQFLNDPMNQFQSTMANQLGNATREYLTMGAGRSGLGGSSTYSGVGLQGSDNAGWSVDPTTGFWG